MRESRTYGSGRGARGNSRPYREGGVRSSRSLAARRHGHSQRECSSRRSCRQLGFEVKKGAAIALAVLAGTIAGAQAQTYPSKPITIIVPFAAGGQSDALARTISDG